MVGWSDESYPAVFTVRELTGYIKRLFDTDEVLQDVVVRGEVSNFKEHRSGHLYFTLKDEYAALECVCFRNVAATIAFRPEDGMQIVAGGRVSVYERQGRYQLIVLFMRPDGLGALRVAFEKLKAKLEAEGLFDKSRKRPLPRFPRCIALVTSPTGAAVRDLVSIISRRFPLARMIIVPTLVQGEQAADSIVASLRAADSIEEVDLIILGRGGGSAEDLWPFNEERVARAIYACRKPTISAVGHETDVTIADLVADMRAATPSAAAELAVPDREELLGDIAALRQRARLAMGRSLEALRGRLGRVKARRLLAHPDALTEAFRLRAAEAERRAAEAMDKRLRAWRARLDVARAGIEAHRPTRTVRAWGERLARSRLRAHQAMVRAIAEREQRIVVARASVQAHAPARQIGQWRQAVHGLWVRAAVAVRHSVASREQSLDAVRARVMAGAPARLVSEKRARSRAAARAAQVAAAETLRRAAARLAGAKTRLRPQRLGEVLAARGQALSALRGRALRALDSKHERDRWRLARARGRLAALDPKAVLKRGYSITYNEASGEIVRAADQVAPSEALRIVLARGEIGARVMETRAPGADDGWRCGANEPPGPAGK